eukprot:scaffold9085_cov215-Amphora_coffeaeformis.AAC.4
MSETAAKKKHGETAPSSSGLSSTRLLSYLDKHRDRKQYLLTMSAIPILICVLAFGRSAYYRVTYKPPECRNFGWFSSSSGEFQCDHKPLDLHATLALMWLATFSIQVILMYAGFNQAHRLFGKLGFVLAFANALGMFWLAIQEAFYNPMPRTDRPPDFTPFMFLVAFKLTVCLVFAVTAVADKTNRNIEEHMLWIYRGFITSFTTPVIRFYPAVLRHLIGDDCFQDNRDKFVMGAMFVSELVCAVVYSMVQLRTRRVFWDVFMKVQALTFVAALVKEIQFAARHGTFVGGMLVCAVDKFVKA